MGLKIYSVNVRPSSVSIQGKRAECLVEIKVKSNGDILEIIATPEYTLEKGLCVTNDKITYIQEEKQIVCDFNEQENIQLVEAFIENGVQILLQEELFGYAITKTEIEPDTLSSNGETSQCYVNFDFSDNSLLCVLMRYTLRDGLVLDQTTFYHLQENHMPSHNEKFYEGNDKFFLQYAKEIGVESRLKYAIVGSNAPATHIKPEPKSHKKKEKGINRYR